MKSLTIPFSQWANRVKAESAASPNALHGEGRSGRPYFLSESLLMTCCGFAVADANLATECHQDLVCNNVYTVLGEGSAAQWERISAWLAQRAGTQVQDPAYFRAQEDPDLDPEQFKYSVANRLKGACCSGEVAIFMLRLAVRTACLTSSGPWASKEALQQLVGADAWSSLMHALRALLHAGLVTQYNAVNIVSDILHVSRALPIILIACNVYNEHPHVYSFHISACSRNSCSITRLACQRRSSTA